MAEQRSPVDGAPLVTLAWNAGLQAPTGRLAGIAAAGGEPHGAGF